MRASFPGQSNTMEKAHPFERIIFAVVFIAVIAGVVLSFVDEHVFEEAYVTEDGPIECFTVCALILGMVVCFRRLVMLRSCRGRLFLVMTFLLGVMFLFGAGEELAWGQRILGFESSEWFKEYNTQQDMTLHNIELGNVSINKLIFSKGIAIVLFIYLLVLPTLYRRNKKAARVIDALAIPLPRPRHIIAAVVLMILVYGVVPSSKRGELGEFSLSWMVLLGFMFPRNASAFDADAERARAEQT